MDKQQDEETKKVLSDGEKLRLMTEHDGWAVARKIMSDKILDLQMIGNVDDSTPEKAIVDLKSRNYAVQILSEFLLKDIEGTVEQHVNNLPKTEKPKGFILREE